ncbi:Aste57867_18818 [Aphanomyces stellatus]|uniref:Aste57867_18818 protein n=1 Tax=Aphanomyces stellatus TaxID=120398 RepID=A0A485LCT3_9STRA|nr:hypothetical protein As57867_018754 [Aphanomyces stellatus]VFT95552.1 Aste57867_18818 [Aphanomyces stellatus]
MKRWPYLVLFFVNAIAAGLLVGYGGDSVLAKIPQLQRCNMTANPLCEGNQTIFRASMVIGIFFFVMMCWSACTETGYSRRCAILGFELPLYLGLLVGAFFLPNAVFDVYSWIAAILSAVFIVMQIIILLDCVYGIRDYVLDKIQAEPGARMWPILYLGLSLGSLVGAIVSLVFLFIYFDGSSLATAFMVITALFLVVLPGLGSLSFVRCLLPPAAMCIYLVFLCWQSLIKIPHFTPSYASSASPILVPSALIGALAVSWTSWRTTESASTFFRLEIKAPDEAPQAAPTTSAQTDAVDTSSVVISMKAAPVSAIVEIEPRAVAPSWQFFFIMFISSFYMAMVMTDWGMDSGPLSGDTAAISLWVQIASQWVTGLLFAWSLVAPLVFQDRDFS